MIIINYFCNLKNKRLLEFASIDTKFERNPVFYQNKRETKIFPIINCFLLTLNNPKDDLYIAMNTFIILCIKYCNTFALCLVITIGGC